MFSEKLKLLRKQKGLSMEELCDEYNKKFDGKLNKSTLSRYENNLQEPMINVVKNLAIFLGVSLDFLADENEPFDILSIPGILPLPKTYKLPLYGNIACGEPIYAEQNIEEYIDTPESVHADFCLRCSGDSMINARILDGDVVFIKKQPTVDNGEIAAVLIDDEATLKRVYYDREDNVLTLVPENPTLKAFRYYGEELEKIRILGKAVCFTSLLN